MNTAVEKKQQKYFMDMMNLVSDDYICEALPQKKTYYKNKKRTAHPFRYASCAAAAAVCMFALLFSSNGYAKSLITSAFFTIQNSIDMRGDYSSYATRVNQAVKSGDLSVTISEVYCDGINLFVSYIIESERGFSAYSENYKNYIQIAYSKLDCIRSENTVYLLNDFGTAGLEGRYIDEHTFVGLETYSLDGKTFPETFDLEISISKFVPEISFGENPFQKNGARGRWNFDIPVTINSADIQTIAVHAKKNEHTIDTVVVSPIMITIYTSYPDLYFNTVNYDVLCYTNSGTDLLLGEGLYFINNGVTRIPRGKAIDNLEIFVVDHTKLTKESPEQYSYEELEKHAIVSCTIDLQ